MKKAATWAAFPFLPMARRTVWISLSELRLPAESCSVNYASGIDSHRLALRCGANPCSGDSSHLTVIRTHIFSDHLLSSVEAMIDDAPAERQRLFSRAAFEPRVKAGRPPT